MPINQLLKESKRAPNEIEAPLTLRAGQRRTKSHHESDRATLAAIPSIHICEENLE
jgi:hypothetical protein